MENYIKTALRATGEAWAVFKTSATTGQNPKLAFEQLREKYKGSDVEDYVNDYTKICEEELPRIRDADTYLSDAKDVGNKVFNIIKMASDIGYDKWDSSVKEYAKRYSALIVWELDRQYQRLHHIKPDWWNFV